MKKVVKRHLWLGVCLALYTLCIKTTEDSNRAVANAFETAGKEIKGGFEKVGEFVVDTTKKGIEGTKQLGETIKKGIVEDVYEKGLRDTIYEKGLKETIYEKGLRDTVYEKGLKPAAEEIKKGLETFGKDVQKMAEDAGKVLEKTANETGDFFKNTIYEKGLKETIYEKGLRDTVYQKGLVDAVFKKGILTVAGGAILLGKIAANMFRNWFGKKIKPEFCPNISPALHQLPTIDDPAVVKEDVENLIPYIKQYSPIMYLHEDDIWYPIWATEWCTGPQTALKAEGSGHVMVPPGRVTMELLYELYRRWSEMEEKKLQNEKAQHPSADIDAKLAPFVKLKEEKASLEKEKQSLENEKQQSIMAKKLIDQEKERQAFEALYQQNKEAALAKIRDEQKQLNRERGSVLMNMSRLPQEKYTLEAEKNKQPTEARLKEIENRLAEIDFITLDMRKAYLQAEKQATRGVAPSPGIIQRWATIDQELQQIDTALAKISNSSHYKEIMDRLAILDGYLRIDERNKLADELAKLAADQTIAADEKQRRVADITTKIAALESKNQATVDSTNKILTEDRMQEIDDRLTTINNRLAAIDKLVNWKYTGVIPVPTGVAPDKLYFDNPSCSNFGSNPAHNRDAQGNLNTPVYVVTYEAEGKIYFQYLHLYGFNAPYDIGPITGDTFDIQNAHECDLEHITIELDKNSKALLRVYYGSHGRTEGFWLTKDQVPYENGHPVVYVARGGHGNYPREGTYVRIYGIANDVTGKHLKWVPQLIRIYDASDTRFDPSTMGWVVFPGSMGRRGVGNPAGQNWWMNTQTGLPGRSYGDKGRSHSHSDAPFCKNPSWSNNDPFTGTFNQIAAEAEYAACITALVHKATPPD